MNEIPPEQREVAQFLTALAGRAPQLTHISAVFVGQDTAWKMKKAVRLDFLDFSTLALRKHFLIREWELNRRTAPTLYRDVVPIWRARAGDLRIGSAPAEAPIVEWVLRMAAVPAEDFLDRMAASGVITPALLLALADAVAAFHLALPPVLGWDSAGALARVIEGNFVAAGHAGLDALACTAWAEAARRALAARATWLAARASAGFVRRGHGDLHLGNICLWEGRPVAFDALEFDESLATIDVGYDLAFLLMDLDQCVDRASANRVLNRYVARTGDAELVAGLALFLSLRAMVLAHVETVRGRARLGARYFAAARAAFAVGPAVILAIGGLPGSGKSSLARAVAPELGAAPGALILRSDDIRKRRHGVAPETRLPASAYGAAEDRAVYGEMFASARQAAAAGHAVIFDASFRDPATRAAAAAAAAAAGVRFLGVWLNAPLPLLEARIAARRDDASDATIAVLRAAAAATARPTDWLEIEASDSTRALAALSARLKAT